MGSPLEVGVVGGGLEEGEVEVEDSEEVEDSLKIKIILLRLYCCYNIIIHESDRSLLIIIN